MKRTPLFSSWLALLLLILAACGAAGPEGDAAPAFRLESVDGNEVSLADYQGKLVLLDFWATWCAPCRAQAAILDKIYPDYQEKGLQILSIDMEEPAEEVRAFAASKEFPYPVLIDESGAVSTDFEVIALPTVVLVDPSGQVVFHQEGITSEGTLRSLIEQHLPDPV